MAQFTIYGPTLSTYVRTIRMIFEETGTPYELEQIDIFKGEQNAPNYLAKNPFGKVPTLAIDDQYLYETNAIAEYLDASLNGGGFTPNDLMTQARMRQIMGIVASYLYASAIGTIVIQRMMAPRQGGESDIAAIEAAVPKTQTALKAIADVANFSPYLLGTEPTLADFYLMPVVFYLSNTPDWEVAISPVPQLKSWWEAVRQRPSFRKVLR